MKTTMIAMMMMVAAASVLAMPPTAAAAAAGTAGIPKPDAKEVVAALFKVLKITDVDPAQCVSDVSGAAVALRDFASDVHHKNVSMASRDLAQGLSGLSTSISGCGVQEVQNKLDALAAAVHFADIKYVDDAVKVLVDASDLWNVIDEMANAISSGDPTQIGNAIGDLLSQWSAVMGECKSNGCKVMDGILRVLQVVAEDITPCESALQPAFASLSDGMASFQKKDFKSALNETAKGLDLFAVALENDACGLKNVGSVLSSLSPALKKAIVQIDSSKAVSIIVGSADLYDTLYHAAIDLEKGDVAGFGMQMGSLLTQLQSSGCATKACVVVEGLLSALKLGSADFAQCSSDLDASWNFVESAIESFELKRWGAGVENVAKFLSRVGSAVGDCGVQDLGKIAEQTATKLGDGAVATEIGHVVQVLVEGADISNELTAAFTDFSNKRWSGFGHDLGNIANMMQDLHCNTFVCKIVEGLLNGVGVAYQDLVACEADLRSAEDAFQNGLKAFGSHDIKDGVGFFAGGLNTVAKSVSDCGLQTELGFIEQEANVLGFSNTSIVGDVASVLVHGADFYEELYSAYTDGVVHHDYRAMGSDLGTVMDTLSKWTQGHACTNDFCYVVVGVLDFMGNVEGSVKQCETDFKDAFDDFKAAVAHFHDSHHSIFHFVHNKEQIRDGVKSIGDGLKLVAKGVSDCHLQEFADLLEKLAVKLGIAPEIGWIEEILHILIEGVNIENEIGDACDDFGEKNWVGFGYNLAKLIKTLL